MRPLVADLVAEAAVDGHFVAISLALPDLPFAPLGPKPKGQSWLETRWLGPEVGLEREPSAAIARITLPMCQASNV
jgi:hypothetical protein